MQAEQGNVNVNVVETSDAEEEEEMRASKYVYWKKEAKHETSDCDDHSPKKRLKLDHTYETVSETPSRGSPSPYLSPLPPSSQPLESVSSSPPFILPSSTPKSSSSVSTPPPPPPQSISEVWDENHDFYDDTLFQENSQDPLLLASQKSIRISKLEQKMLEFPPSPITSLYSNDSESHSRRSLVSSAYGTPTSSPAPTRSQSPVPTRLQSVDPLSLFNTPPPYQPPELPVAIVSPITNDVKMLLSPVQQPPSPHLSLSSSMAAPYLLRSPSQPPISPSPLTPPSPHTHGNVLDPLFDSSPSNTLSILPSPVEQNQEPTIAPLSELEIANMSDQPRYSLRRRGANQLKPYTIEKLQYKKALSSNPDAIVKFRSPTRGGHRHHYVDDVGGSQWEPYAADEDDPWEESQWLRSTENAQAGPSRLPASDKPDEDVRPSVQYSEFLQDLPTTDEEEAKELKALSKEARKAVRERRAKEAREAKEKLNRKKPKSFPLSKGHTVTDKPRPRTGSSHFDADDSATNPEFPSRSASKEKEPNRPSTPVFISSIPPDLFPDLSNDFRPLSPMELSDHDGDHAKETFEESHNIPMDGVEPTSDIGEGDMDGGRLQSPRNEVGNDGRLALPDDPLDRKRMKVLGRMVPAFMLKHLAKDSSSSKPTRKRQRSVTVVSGSDDDGAEGSELQPGKTRTRWVKHPKDDIEIKGDTESSDDERSSLSDSESEGSQRGFPPFSHTSRRRMEAGVIVISDSSEEESHGSSDDGVDDETIQAYLDGKITNRKPRRVGQKKEESLIDWMLSRAQTIGGPRKANLKKRSSSDNLRRKASSQKKYKMDVMTNHGKGMGRERQSKLNFDHLTGDTGSKPSSKRSGGFRPTFVGPRRPEVDAEDDFGHSRNEVRVPLVNGISKKKSRKEKAKDRRTRAKANGVYTFGSNDAQVVTGRRARGMVTIDIEEDDLNAGGPAWYYALTPANQTASASSNPPKKVLSLHQSGAGQENSPDGHEQRTNGVKSKPHRRKITRPGDFGIPVLHSGLSFTGTTFIGKGWLHELCEVISPTGTPSMPIITSLRGIEVGPSMSLERFTKSLGEVLDGLFNFTTGLPAFDSADEAKEWAVLSRACCHLLSWRLSTGGEDDHTYLHKAVHEQVSKFVLRVRGLCLEASALDLSTFFLCWFLVELSVRLGQTTQRQSSNSLSEAIALLVQHLLEFDIETTMVPVCEGSPLDSSTTARYTAELWVCLFHLLDTRHRMAPEIKQPHPFWLVLQKGLEYVSLLKNLNPYETSEAIWGAIFSLCALAQFSVHGMALAKSHLPAYWELVVVALKKLPLNANPTLDDNRPIFLLKKRDIHANLAVRRCVDLSHRWEWSLEQSSSLFNQLVEIFRSRKFANLRHEPPDYPLFMRDNRWDLPLNYRRGDSAFVLFLRLLVKAANYDPMNPTRTPSPRAKKLLSLAIPVGSLGFSKDRPTAIRDLSTLSVRLAAIAVGIHVDPTSHASRIAHARTYVNFSDADETTRKAVIRGIRYIGVLMTTWSVPLDAIADWIRAIAGELADELKKIPKTPNNLTKRNGVSMAALWLVGCVRHIFKAHQACSEYPEPALLSSLRIFLISDLSSETRTLDELRLLIETMLDARGVVMPPPERPQLAPIESQESQDDYGDFDFDLSDPALLAALGDTQAPAVEQSNYKVKEEKMRQAMKTTQLHYFAWGNFNAFVKEPHEYKSDHEYFDIVDSWIYCWVGATLIATDGGSERASGKIFQLWDPFRKTLQRDVVNHRQRRVDLTIMLCLLKLDPMSYAEIQDRYIKVLMDCLIAIEVGLDSAYVALLFSVDGLRHPLLVGVPCERESEAVDFNIPSEAFGAVSLEILQTILLNLATLCDDMGSDRDKYLDFVKGMLSTMRRLSMDERWKSRPAYVERCRRVVRMVNEHLGNRLPGLAFFMDWGRTLG